MNLETSWFLSQAEYGLRIKILPLKKGFIVFRIMHEQVNIYVKVEPEAAELGTVGCGNIKQYSA